MVSRVRAKKAFEPQRCMADFSAKAAAMGITYIQWADMIYTSLMPKPKPMCNAISRAKNEKHSHINLLRLPHQMPITKSATTSASTT